MQTTYETRSFENIYNTDELQSSPAACARFANELSTNGIACIKISGLDSRAAIKEIWKTLVTEQPWDDEHQIKLYVNGRLLDKNVDEDMEKILDIITNPLNVKMRKYLHKRWLLHRQFGRECGSMSFWQHSRCKIVENEGLYGAMSAALGTNEFWADLNGTITRLPGEGEHAFLHWDLDPRTVTNHATKQICGKVCYTEARFICVPGTHTKEFLDDFVDTYGKDYTHIKLGANKFGLRQDKPDPFNLWSRQCSYIVPAGHWVCWDSRVLHGHYKLALRSHIQWGTFMGFSIAGDTAQQTERKRLYDTGEVPKTHPSGDLIKFVPRKYDNFPRIFKSMILDRLDPKRYEELIFVRKNGKGKDTFDTKGWGWSEKNPYIKYNFSPKGKRIIGIKPWSSLNVPAASNLPVVVPAELGEDNRPRKKPKTKKANATSASDLQVGGTARSPIEVD